MSTEEIKKEEPLVAKRARARHAPPSTVERRLAFRRLCHKKAVEDNRLDERAYHKPGSLNRHKC